MALAAAVDAPVQRDLVRLSANVCGSRVQEAERSEDEALPGLAHYRPSSSARVLWRFVRSWSFGAWRWRSGEPAVGDAALARLFREARPKLADSEVRGSNRDFDRAEPFAGEDAQAVLRVGCCQRRGVSTELWSGPLGREEPAQVPLALIAGMMMRCDSKGRLRPPRLLNAGDLVEVTGGAVCRVHRQGRERRS